MTSAAPVVVEKVLPRKKQAGSKVPELRERFATWLNVWCSSLIGELLWMSTKR